MLQNETIEFQYLWKTWLFNFFYCTFPMFSIHIPLDKALTYPNWYVIRVSLFLLPWHSKHGTTADNLFRNTNVQKLIFKSVFCSDELVDHYGISISRLLTNMFGLMASFGPTSRHVPYIEQEKLAFFKHEMGKKKKRCSVLHSRLLCCDCSSPQTQVILADFGYPLVLLLPNF